MNVERWSARLGANLKAYGYDDNRAHFTVGHGGYFSPLLDSELPKGR